MNNSDITALTKQLKEVQLQKHRIEAEERRIVTHLNHLTGTQTRPPQDAPRPVRTRSVAFTSAGLIDQKATAHRHLDSTSKIIHIGDIVKFCTYTKFKGFYGKVVKTTRQRVITHNYEGREVVKEGRNLTIVNKDTDLKDGYTSA